MVGCKKCGKKYHAGQMCPIYHGEEHDAVCIPCCEKCEYYKWNDILGLLCQFWERNPVKRAERELNNARRREKEAAEKLDRYYSDGSNDQMIIQATRNYRFFAKERDLAERRLVVLKREESKK